MDIKNLRSKDAKALTELMHGKQKELMSLRFQIAAQELTNTSLIAKTRKDIAQIKTVLTEKRAKVS